MACEATRLLAVSVCIIAVVANFFKPCASIDADRMSFGSSLDGNKTLISNGGVFELGLFTPVGGRGRYLGVWYHGIPGPTVVWVANRQSPVLDSHGEIRLSAGGQLQIVAGNETVLWCSTAGNVTGSGSARLLDSGNFVIRYSYDDGSSIFWQSFDHPTDTLLPGMHLGDLGSRISTSLTAWTEPGDPSPANLKFQLMQGSGLTQFELVNGRTVIYATSPWNGAVTTGGLFLNSNEFNFSVICGSFSYSTRPSLLSRFVLDSFVWQLRLFIWINNKWVAFSYYPSDPCDTYGYCGANGYCNVMKTPLLCTCLPGFKPRSVSNWRLRDFSNGCVHQKSLECSANSSTDGFRLFKGKLPETKSAKTYNGFFSVNKCQHICLSNCSCRAFTASSIGCTIWTGDLLDMRQYNLRSEQEVYIRVAHSDASPSPTADPQATHHSKSHHKKTITIAVSVIAGITTIVIICVLIHCYGLVPWKRGSEIETFMKTQGSSQPRWPVKYTYTQLKRITRSFSVKLGTGGYGAVYQGYLPGPSNVPVAVKILTNKTGRGEDFENEIITISRASHYNIISLIGYCLEGSHRALVYEYMHNGSLNLLVGAKKMELPDIFSKVQSIF